MNLKEIHLCFIGNMLGRNPNYTPSQGQIIADLFTNEGYKISSVSSKINRVTRLTEIIKTLIKGYRTFDIVLIGTFSGLNFIISDVAGFLCRVLKLPVIMFLHGGNLPQFIQKHPRWAKRVLNRANRLIAPSSFLAEKIGALGYEIQVIPNVIDLSRYPCQERSKISPRLIWMRSFHPIYNPEMAIKVLAQLRESEPEAILTMAGADKGLEDKVKLMAEEMNLSDVVRFAGFLDLEKKLKEFSDADIYINTNRIDNMPVSVVEARALGLPIIATNVGGLPYLIEHGENGFLVPSEDVNSMVKNIKMLLDSPELTKKISQNGRVLAERSAWTSVRQEWEKLFEKILERKFIEKETNDFGSNFEVEKLKN